MEQLRNCLSCIYDYIAQSTLIWTSATCNYITTSYCFLQQHTCEIFIESVTFTDMIFQILQEAILKN